jgi:hypothetical protein
LALDTGVIPPALKDKPNLQGFDIEVWNAFARLSARRHVNGFGAISAIPYVEISAYMEIVARIDDIEDQSVFIELIEHLDSAFLQEYAERQRKEAEKNPKKGRSKI